MNSRENQTGLQKPNEYFDDASFKTLYGGVVVTWVSTSAIVDLFGGSIDPKMVGFVIALIVALVGFFLKEDRSWKKFVITPFNGLLIYLTIMGGTSFLPPPGQDANIPQEGSSEEVTEAIPERQVYQSAFLTSWNPDQDLLNAATQLEKENVELKQDTTQLRQVNMELMDKVEFTRESIRELEISPEVRETLMNRLEVGNIQNLNLHNNPQRYMELQQ
jgi:hypothetical protein